jgi:hypothetical protein
MKARHVHEGGGKFNSAVTPHLSVSSRTRASAIRDDMEEVQNEKGRGVSAAPFRKS